MDFAFQPERDGQSVLSDFCDAQHDRLIAQGPYQKENNQTDLQ
jgi:hypothetical protein